MFDSVSFFYVASKLFCSGVNFIIFFLLEAAVFLIGVSSTPSLMKKDQSILVILYKIINANDIQIKICMFLGKQNNCYIT